VLVGAARDGLSLAVVRKLLSYIAPAAAAALALLGALCGSFATEEGRLLPFSQFLHGVERARPQDYVGAPGTAVKDRVAFEEMRQHLLRLYDGVRVSHSFATDGQIFDCVPIGQQPGLRRQTPKALPAPPPGSPRPGGSAIAADRLLAAEVQAQGCPTGTIPMRRITLQEMTRFPTLRRFLAK